MKDIIWIIVLFVFFIGCATQLIEVEPQLNCAFDVDGISDTSIVIGQNTISYSGSILTSTINGVTDTALIIALGMDNDVPLTNGLVSFSGNLAVFKSTDLTSSLILDSDCDGITDDLDLCPGINDNIDMNGDNLPDCKYPPGYANVISQWKCGSPSLQKVYVCTKTPSGGFKTVCTYYSAVQMHINNGGFLGVCGSASCN